MQALRPTRGAEVYLYSFLTAALEGSEGSASRPGRSLPPRKTRYPLWAPGPFWTGAENLVPTGIRSPDRPARSQSLYRLSYRAHNVTCSCYIFLLSRVIKSIWVIFYLCHYCIQGANCVFQAWMRRISISCFTQHGHQD